MDSLEVIEITKDIKSPHRSCVKMILADSTSAKIGD